MAAISAILDRSGFPRQSVGHMHGFEDPESFGNLVLDVPLPGWTLRVVRDRGSYELWFQTERGKAWHDLQHLLVAAFDRPPGRARGLGLPGDAAAPAGVRPAGVLLGIDLVPGLWQLAVYSDLVDFLSGELGHRVHLYAYDWRRDLDTCVNDLGQYLEGL